MARQRDRDGKDVQHVRVIKDRVLTSEDSVLRRWKEYFQGLMNEENERERRGGDGGLVNQKVREIGKEEVRAALKRIKNGKAVGLVQMIYRCGLV